MASILVVSTLAPASVFVRGFKLVLEARAAVPAGIPAPTVQGYSGAMGGLETMRRLRQLDPDVRAIVSSGYSADRVMADYHGYGFRGVIAKPFSRAELTAGILAALEDRVSAARDARRPAPPA